MEKIILTGAPRSGTSLLHSLLNAHDSIELAFEKGTWDKGTSLINGVNSALNLLSLNKYKRRLGSNYLIDIFSKRDSENKNTTQKKVTKSKNIIYSGTKMCVPNQIPTGGIKHLYKKGWKIIFIFRDGRDSILSMHKRAENTIDFASYKWNSAINLMKKFESNPNVMIVPFESLLFKEKEVLSKICDFLEIEFQEKMLYGFTDIEKEEYKKSTLDRSKAFSYKDKKNKKLISEIEEKIRKNLGYCDKKRKEFEDNL